MLGFGSFVAYMVWLARSPWLAVHAIISYELVDVRRMHFPQRVRLSLRQPGDGHF
jgi:hypothetical protein